ncbi:MAG: YhbY family RNA-binding protein [Erysipelotrichaceae bacterium]|nr:YhbY family RNA-binding protein [Erysipelotrichaceae bacterium]
MLSNDNKKKLRAMAQTMNANIQLGKGGLDENLFMTLENELEAHELVKVSLLKTCGLPVREAAIECASMSQSEIVQIIGRTFVLYRKSKKNKLGIKG